MNRLTQPFDVLGDDRVRRVLRRLHEEAARQTPRLLLHYLPKLPALLLGRPIRFRSSDISGFYADKFIALEPAQAAFCYLAARALRAKTIVEFGTSFGVSTIWLAAAVRDGGGGKVIGTEIVPDKVARARDHVEEAGLSQWVEIRQGDALVTLRDLDGDVDLLLNDGFPELALDVVKLVAPRMRAGAAVITDNVGTFKANYTDYMTHMTSPESGFQTAVVPFKSGTAFSVRSTGISIQDLE
ncbi:MAG: class I SAM-dependent methyltransferase [Proteobacteria bacterium]|nr:class I SAM-dependent methyltransferase [Pseudomonadota bacterium]